MFSIVEGKASHDPYPVGVYHLVEVAVVEVGVSHHFQVHILVPPPTPSVPPLDCTPIVVVVLASYWMVEVDIAVVVVVVVAVTVIHHDQHRAPYLDQPQLWYSPHPFQMEVVVPQPTN
jgi:hypothetical protein